MVNEGKILEAWLKAKRWSTLDLARELDMTKENVYYHTKKEKIAEIFKLKLEQKGFNDIFPLVKTITNIEEPEAVYGKQKPPDRESDLLKIISILEEKVSDKEKIIHLLEEKIKRAETIEKVFVSALKEKTTLKEFHNLIESAVVE